MKPAIRCYLKHIYTMKTLFVVESPSKISSISKYIGSDYIVCASVGHMLDLSPKTLSVDTDTMKTTQAVIRGKAKQIAALRKAFQNCDEVLLAGDPDRERGGCGAFPSPRPATGGPSVPRSSQYTGWIL